MVNNAQLRGKVGFIGFFCTQIRIAGKAKAPAYDDTSTFFKKAFLFG